MPAGRDYLHIRRHKRNFLLLFLPFLLFTVLTVALLLYDHLQREAIFYPPANAYPMGEFLYQQFEVTELFSDPLYAEGYVYYLVKTSSSDSPYLLLRYPDTEAEKWENLLQNHLPAELKGRTDYALGEVNELIRLYYEKPLREIDPEAPIFQEGHEYDVFNIGTMEVQRQHRLFLLVCMAVLLLSLPFLYLVLLRAQAKDAIEAAKARPLM